MLNFKGIKYTSERADWGEHPYTRYALREMGSTMKDRALLELLGRCAKSHDAEVRAAHAEYRALEEAIEFFKLTAKGEENGD